MAELSQRFAALMARLAQGDAELFRTLGEQNASVRQLVEGRSCCQRPSRRTSPAPLSRPAGT